MELLVGILILSAALIPVYHVFVTSRRNVFSSKISYMAVHAAREELEEIRQLPFRALVDGTVEHEFRPVEGHVLHVTFEQLDIADPPEGLEADMFTYPEEYQRIETKVSVLDTEPPDPRLKRVVLLVRWQEKGTSPEEGEAGFRKALSRYETIVANHRIE